jgi:hypothetical protein
MAQCHIFAKFLRTRSDMWFVCIDWDMIVVVNDFVGPLVKTATHPGATLPGFEEGVVLSEKLDVTVYHVDYWKYLFRENVLRLLLCMAIPKKMVLIEKETVKFELNYQRMKFNLYDYVKARERRSKKYWAHGQLWSSKKQLLHVLRVIEVAHQLVKTGKIVDYTTANHFWSECEAIDFPSWDVLLKWFKDIYNPLYEPLKLQLNIYKTVFAELSGNVNPMQFLDYLQFHGNNDTQCLDRELSVRTVLIDYPTTEEGTAKTESNRPLYLFERGWESPRHDAIQQCYRVVGCREEKQDSVDLQTPTWRVLALAPKKYWDFGADKYVVDPSERFVGKLDYTTTMVFKKPQGIGVLLFWDQNEIRALFASSGLYTAAFAMRHNVSLGELGPILYKPFWETFRRKGFQNPGPEAQNWTFQFVFHPDEDMLLLDAIMDNTTFKDISMVPTSSLFIGESSMEPILLFYANSLNWDSIERVQVTFPSKLTKTDNAILKNMEVMMKLASAATDMSLLRYEGFLLIDQSETRLQVSLPQYQSLSLLYSPYERKYRTKHFLKIVRATINLPPLSEGGMSGEARFCVYFPQWTGWYQYIASILRRMCTQLDTAYQTVAKFEDQTEFKNAAEAISYMHSRIFWKLRAAKSNALDYFTAMTNLNEGPAPSLLQAWIDHFNVFDDVANPHMFEEE